MGFKVPIDMLDNLKRSIIKTTAMLEDMQSGKKLKASDVTETIMINKALVAIVELNFDTNYERN